MRRTRPAPGAEVRFRLGEACCPDPRYILDETTPELEVMGQVVFLSDGGHKGEPFAVVQVKGIPRPIVVPANSLKSVVKGADIRTIIGYNGG